MYNWQEISKCDRTRREWQESIERVVVDLQIHPDDAAATSDASALATTLQISPVTAKILLSRKIKDVEQAREFLNPSFRHHLPDPSGIKNAEQAAELILDAVVSGELITIYSDFDVDGLTSGAQLALFLTALGANVQSYIPNRFIEGYGLAASAIEKIAQTNCSLLITVDCGITNLRELELARRKRLKTVVIDHHQPAGELPVADCIVNPLQEGCDFANYRLCAAGLVWMLLIVMRRLVTSQAKYAALLPRCPDPKDFIDLAAIGTICDMVPLLSLNRLIAHRGVQAIRASNRPGVRALLEVADMATSPRFGAGHVAFGIGPRINAAGRLDDATQVAALLTTPDQARAKKLAQAIDRLNRRRQDVEAQVKEHCLAMIRQREELLGAPALAVFGEDYHLGVVGIVAQRLVEEFYRPCAVMGLGEVGDKSHPTKVVKGSVRSIPGFDVAEVLHELSPLLIAGGGHAAAGGFTVALERLSEFQQAFIKCAEQRLTPQQLVRRQRADVCVSLGEIDFIVADELQRLGPFGVGNPSPILLSKQVTIDSVTSMKNRHLRLRFSDGKHARQAVAWSFEGHPLLRRGEVVDILYQVEINNYQGVSSVQLSLVEVCKV